MYTFILTPDRESRTLQLSNGGGRITPPTVEILESVLPDSARASDQQDNLPSPQQNKAFCVRESPESLHPVWRTPNLEKDAEKGCKIGDE